MSDQPQFHFQSVEITPGFAVPGAIRATDGLPFVDLAMALIELDLEDAPEDDETVHLLRQGEAAGAYRPDGTVAVLVEPTPFGAWLYFHLSEEHAQYQLFRQTMEEILE